MSTESKHFLYLSDELFDWDSVVVEEPVTHTFNKGNAAIEWVTSKVYFPGLNGEKKRLYFELAPQKLWCGPNYKYKENKTLENLEGFQISYPVSNLKGSYTNNEYMYCLKYSNAMTKKTL